MSGHEPQGRVEPHVVHGAGHCLETDHRGAILFQPLDAGGDDHLADPLPLIIRMNRQRTHPALDARPMHHVERGDPIARVAPDHRSVFGVGDGELPNCRVEMRYADADHAVLTVSLRKSFAEDGVERLNLAHAHPLRRLRHPGVPPVAGECHYAPAPAPLSTDSSVTCSRARGSRSKKLRCSRITGSPPSVSLTIELPVTAS